MEDLQIKRQEYCPPKYHDTILLIVYESVVW
ncbi:hypothetical protein APH_0943 [Anaplasma phagocytophilum str. HZ]|uniref:Uncharacterized protein n=1 Tax=Anaplasma phagocytophilum (strain HZ) TaxID=212042 RepID=Q2GJD8_ANAPZ|nr:hypothetical protein APH_0943 [Anaplasma phagocytophilum str. HZ]